MRRRGRGAGLAMLVVALFAGASAPAFADETPPTTTVPVATTPPTTDPGAPAPDTTVPPDETPATTEPSTDPETPAPETEPATTDPAAGAPADAPALVNPVVTVTPSTDLVNLQSVTVAGTGFSPSVGVGWAVCRNDGGTSTSDNCDLNRIGTATTDGTGAFSASYVVHRILHTANGDVDCASAPATCQIGVANIAEQSEGAYATLAFDPNAPLPPPPTLLAGPLTGLREGDDIALFGGKFVPDGPVAIVQCSQPTVSTCQTLATVGADAGGNFIASVAVHRLLATPPFGAIDCADAPDTCQLRAVSLADYDFEAHVFLSFDPDGPLPTAQVTVDPDTDLLNFQSVTVHGTGFSGGIGVQIAQCKSDATSYEDCAQSNGFAPLAGDGTFTTTLTVRRVLHLESGDFDCASAPGACSLVSTAFGPSVSVVVSPLGFDASVPPPPPPAITVTPDTDLVQGQSVTVTGANFPPNSPVQLGECLSASAQNFCPGIGALAVTDASGAFTQTFAARRGVIDYLGAYPPDVVDCAESPGLCSVVAFSFDGGDNAAHSISFDPSVPITQPDTTVSPQTDLPDRAIVHVHSTGFAPWERVRVTECVAGAPVYSTSCLQDNGVAGYVSADGSGVVDTALRVHRDLQDSGGLLIVTADGTTNCASSFGACVLRVQSIDDPLVSSDTQLGFDPTAVAPGPTITIDPAGPYHDGQQVQVHGEGFTPGAPLGLGECKSNVEPPEGKTCDSGPDGVFAGFWADVDGTFTRTVTLHTQVETTAGTLDCSGPDACALVAGNRNAWGAERTAVPLDFGVGPVTEGVIPARALAFTGAGSSARPTAVAGFALALVGGALVLVARRRRTAERG